MTIIIIIISINNRASFGALVLGLPVSGESFIRAVTATYSHNFRASPGFRPRCLPMKNFKDQHDKPSVKLLLAALSWLTTRRRRPPDLATQSAITHHLHMLVLHPASDNIDIQAGFYMAGRTGMDADGLLARFGDAATRYH